MSKSLGGFFRPNIEQKYKHERSDSEDEMKIPLAELARRLKRKEESNYSDSSSEDEDKPAGLRSSTNDETMDIGHVQALSARRKRFRKHANTDKSKIKNLLKVIGDVL